MSLIPASHYWFVERDQVGVAYYDAGAWTSPASAVTVRIYGTGYPDDLAAESDSFNFPTEFHPAPLYYALYQYAMLKGDMVKYQMFKAEFAEKVREGIVYAANNRIDASARTLAQGLNGVGL